MRRGNNINNINNNNNKMILFTMGGGRVRRCKDVKDSIVGRSSGAFSFHDTTRYAPLFHGYGITRTSLSLFIFREPI
jgi:hypothetical protein